MSVKKSLRDATLTNSKYSYKTSDSNPPPSTSISYDEWARNPAWLPMPGFNYVDDNTFGTGFGTTGAGPRSVEIQSDGKIVVGGVFTTYQGTTRNKIVRLNVDGTYDSTFSIGTGFSTGGESVRNLKIQPDGKIVVGGSFTSYQGVTSNRIIRLNSDGSIDTSFNIGTGFNNNVLIIVLQPDGKILVGGAFTTYQGVTSNNIIRLNSNGSIDTSFNVGTGFGGSLVPIDIKIDYNGKILIVGSFDTYNGNSYSRIVRLNNDGSVDTSFNVGTGFGPTDDVWTIDFQTNNKIILGGQFTTYQGVTANRIIRLNYNGSIDTSFNVGTGFNSGVFRINVRSDDYIFVGGSFTEFNGTGRSKFTVLNPDGSLNTALDPGTGFDATVWTVTSLSNGKIVVGGEFTTYRGTSENSIVQLTVTEEKVVILKAINNTAYSEFVDLDFAANYTVNWGDGNTINYSANTVATHYYNYFDANLDNTNGNVSFIDAGDLVFRTNHGYANTNTISFANIATTTGVTVDTPYYVINANTSYFQLSNTSGGSAVTLTTDGTGYILPYKQVLITVTPQSGNTITKVNLAARSASMNNTGLLETHFLDIGMSIPRIVNNESFTIGSLISGTIPKLNFNLERVFIANISSSITSLAYKFYFNEKLQSVPLFDTSNVTSMFYMFSYAGMASIPLFNTINVTTFSATFYESKKLVNVPNFNTSNVTSMQSMFNTCTSLQTVPLFNTAKVTDMQNMFYQCYNLVTVPKFDTSAVQTMAGMFSYCFRLSSVPAFNTPALTATNTMFYYCTELVNVPWFDTSKVTNISAMFQYCYILETVPLYNFTKATIAQSLFSGCYNLKSVPRFDFRSCSYLDQSFYNCSSLKSVPQFNTSSAINMQGMFANCNSLEEVPLLDTSNNTSFSSFFYGCTKLKKVPLLNTSKGTDFSSMFAYCSSLTSVPAFDTSNATNMYQMFFSAEGMRSVPDFNTSKVTNMQQMFYSNYSLVKAPNFNTANVTTMYGMFAHCGSLKSVPLYNTAKVTLMSYMFPYCSSLETVPNFNTANVVANEGTFQGCYSLKELPAFNCNALISAPSNIVYQAKITRSQLANVRYSIDYSNNNLANVELNEIYTNLPTVTSQTITVTGNWGTASDDPTIATAKGWTVTG